MSPDSDHAECGLDPAMYKAGDDQKAAEKKGKAKKAEPEKTETKKEGKPK